MIDFRSEYQRNNRDENKIGENTFVSPYKNKKTNHVVSGENRPKRCRYTSRLVTK